LPSATQLQPPCKTIGWPTASRIMDHPWEFEVALGDSDVHWFGPLSLHQTKTNGIRERGMGVMDLRMARLCLDCEEIFESNSRCPKCGSGFWHPIMRWIRPLGEAEKRVVIWRDALILSERNQSQGLTVLP